MPTNSPAPDRLPVRVWFGFRREDLDEATFRKQIADVLIPATIWVGHHRQGALSGYMPSLPKVNNQSAAIPDECALVWYKSIEAYETARATLEGRSYQLLHNAMFSSKSSSNGFPVRFGGTYAFNQPYFLWDDGSKWMDGRNVRHHIGLRKDGVEPEAFRQMVETACKQLVAENDASADNHSQTKGIIVRGTEDMVSVWTNGVLPIEPFWQASKDVYEAMASPTRVPENLNNKASWVILPVGSFENFQF